MKIRTQSERNVYDSQLAKQQIVPVSSSSWQLSSAVQMSFNAEYPNAVNYFRSLFPWQTMCDIISILNRKYFFEKGLADELHKIMILNRLPFPGTDWLYNVHKGPTTKTVTWILNS